jgi:NAD(P)-dependent dehydrogenase (short-subunit alcohol dehydrogenase family)
MSLQDRVAVITGATGNLGTAVTKRLVSEHAQVVLTYYDEAELEALLPQLTAETDVLPFQCDVTVEAQVRRIIQETHDQLGGPHILLNLVGGYAGGDTIVDTSETTWDRMMALNLKSAFLCCKYALTYMVPQDYGRIVNVSSKVAVDLPAKSAAYAVSKAAVISLTKCLAQELKGTGVSVAAIMPGIIDTPATRQARPQADFAKWVKPEAIADVLSFLVRYQGGALNGAIMPLFGGL